MSELSKAYEPQSVEDKWYDYWVKQGCFTAEPARVSSKRPAYSIVIPPPNVTGVLHMGHVLNNTIQDILARKARMDGKEVLWLPGTDHAGIATERQVEKALKKDERKSKQEIGREEFIKRVWTWKEKHGGIIIQQLKKLGCSCDWTRERFTMDPEYVRCVQKVFVELYKKGLIYRGKRMVNWCPVSQTALSDEEVEMKSQKGFMYYFKVEVVDCSGAVSAPKSAVTDRGSAVTDRRYNEGQIKSTGAWLTIATTRPETIPGDTAVAVNPKDPRYAHLIGKHIVRPLPPELPREQKLIPIVGDEHVDFEFGTGVLKVTPAHDKADFEIGQRHKLPLVDIMNPDATMNALAGQDLNGLDRFVARNVATEKLRELGALVEEKPYENNVGFSQRADVPIEPRLSEQWFLKYPAVEQAKACVEQRSAELPLGANPADETRRAGARRSGGMRFHPDRWAKVYDHWLANIQDWCISRQLWWGHRIPVWYSQGWAKLGRRLVIVRLTGAELAGRNVRELRASAFQFARERGILGQDFLNLDTHQSITVHKSSLEHGFSNFGVANVKLVPGLPELLRHALRVSVEPHMPPSDHVKCVETYLAALQLGNQFFRVKFRVKVFSPNFRLYDHQTVLLWRETSEPDGIKSPEEHVPRDMTSRPASGSDPTLGDLVGNVNTSPAFTRCQIERPGEDWAQDPDVLDTWFSSWLWPFATMGWIGDKSQDSNNPTLNAFYPTSDLVTGPDIIFFWVARMIMAGYEYMGEMPFRNVYFTGIIRDKQGRKMSKSLGNSPDPLELIAKYGADALRFGTMRSAPLGQDVLFDEKDVELGRNFCNKLWNACRFRQMQGGEVQGEIDALKLRSDDKWILLKLHQAIKEMNAAFEQYKFNEATATLYRFFWSEYCDWYVETTKAVLAKPVESLNRETLNRESLNRERVKSGESGDDLTIQRFNDSTAQRTNDSTSAARRANVLAVMDFVLSHALRLFHPFLPFITEELWHGMGYSEGMPADQGGRSILFAPWPKPFDSDIRDHYALDDCYLELVDARFDLITKGRDLRRQASVPANKKVKFILKPAQDLPPNDLEVMRLLLGAEPLEVNPSYESGKGVLSTKATMGELYLPLEGLVDIAAEIARLTKEIEKFNSEIAKVEQKLANPNFVNKSPPEVVAEHRQRLEDWQAKLAHAQKALAALTDG